MRLFQDLNISGNSDDLQKLRTELLRFPNGWEPFKRNDEWTKWPSSSQATPFIALDVPEMSRLRPATLFLLLKDEGQTAFVGNIVPDNGSLSQEEYNAILKSFCEECIQPYKERYHLKYMFSAEVIFVDDILSPHNRELLNTFENFANKSTGASHPLDYQRWITFIGASAQSRERLRTDLLEEWLREKGFPDYIAADLAQQYNFGFDLIEKMGKETPHKAEQEAIHADR